MRSQWGSRVVGGAVPGGGPVGGGGVRRGGAAGGAGGSIGAADEWRGRHVVTMETVNTIRAVGKMHKLTSLSEGMPGDAMFARQLRRKFVGHDL